MDTAEPHGLALVALGSYARRELCAASDIDLLLLHDGRDERALTELVQAVCYPLWDAGLSVSHAVRTPREALRAAAERVEDATALTDRRLVAGDAGLLDELAERVSRWLRRSSGSVLSDLAAADAERHARFGDSPGMLEPDVKGGVGGLRDLHSLSWASACVLGEVGLDPLVGARYLGASDRRELGEAGRVLLEARCALHLVTARAGVRPGSDLDRLRLHVQDEVAERLGLHVRAPERDPGAAPGSSAEPDSPSRRDHERSGAPLAGDELLRRVGLAMRRIAHLHARTWPLLLAAARSGRRRRAPPEPLGDGLALVDGLVEVDERHSLAAEPSLGLRAVAAAAVRHTQIGRATASRLRREISEQGTLTWNAEAREALLAGLRRGSDAVGAFADADMIGLLSASIPGWERIRGLPQRNPLHRYDVDTHGLLAAAQLVAIAGGSLDSAHAKIWSEIADQDTVLLGTWLHDVGKGLPGDHSVTGARLARDWIRHMGFDARADRIAALVRHHLLLPDVATRRDLDDEHEILAVARVAGDAETLDGLYLLSLADSRATGPAAWSPWKDQLLAALYERVRRVLVDDVEALRRTFSLSRVIVEARALLDDPRGLDELLEALPRRYLLASNPPQVAAHAGLLLPLPEAGTLRASHRRGAAAGTGIVSVVAGDRRGLMASCAGVLAAHGLSVLDARAFTRPDGVALDWFVVRTTAQLDWDRVESDLRRAAAGALDVAEAVARRERRRDQRPPPLAAPIPVEVGIDGDRVEIRGPDGPGVLYRMARVLADAGLDVLGARVDTLGPQVHDVFFTRGDPPPDLEQRVQAAYRA